MKISTILIPACVVSLALAFPAMAADYTVTIKDHVFTPSELKLPANEKINLLVKNEDPTPEEFESHDLKREKIIKGNSEAVIKLGPLKPGTYSFFGEFHEKTAQGKIVVE